MRIALLSCLELMVGEAAMPRAFARIGGRKLFQKQLEFALASGCERIICLSHNLAPEIIKLQHEAENAGAQFHCIRNNSSLSGIVSASDDILVIGDGLAFEDDIAREALSDGRRVLTLPADAGVAAGFERIDSNHSWAGLMLLSGSLIERLSQLPVDSSAQSSLLRLALQSGAKTCVLDEAVLADHKWQIIDSPKAAEVYSDNWLGNAVAPAPIVAPVRSLAGFSALAVIRRHHDPARALTTSNIVSLAMLLIAAICGYFSQAISGFLAIVLSVFAFEFGQTISAITDYSKQPSKVERFWNIGQPLAFDAALIGMSVIAVSSLTESVTLFAGLVLIGLIRIVEGRADIKHRPLLDHAITDRGTLGMIGVVLSATGILLAGLQTASLFVLGLLIMRSYRSKLT